MTKEQATVTYTHEVKRELPDKEMEEIINEGKPLTDLKVKSK